MKIEDREEEMFESGLYCLLHKQWVNNRRGKGEKDMTKRDLSAEMAQHYPQYAVNEVELMVNTILESLTASKCGAKALSCGALAALVCATTQRGKDGTPKPER